MDASYSKPISPLQNLTNSKSNAKAALDQYSNDKFVILTPDQDRRQRAQNVVANTEEKLPQNRATRNLQSGPLKLQQKHHKAYDNKEINNSARVKIKSESSSPTERIATSTEKNP